MATQVLFFGQLADITGKGNLQLENIADTHRLVQHLHELYPGLAGLPYLMAVNKEVVHTNTLLDDNSTVALLPPYAGG